MSQENFGKSDQKAGAQSPAAAPYRRSPNSLRMWLQRAELDFALLGRVERLVGLDAELLASMVRADPGEYRRLAVQLARLVDRMVTIVDAATEAHEAIAAAMR